MKKGSVDTIVLIVLVVVLIGLVVFFGIKYTNVKNGNNENAVNGIAELQSQNQNASTEKQIEVKEKEVYGIIDVQKSLGSDTYLCKSGSGEFGSAFSVKLESGKLYINFAKKENLDENVYLGNHEYYQYYEIPEINGRVVDFNITYHWQNPVPIIVMLKEDGNVYAADWNRDRKEFLGERKIEGLENIIRIDEVRHTYKMPFGNETSDMERQALVATDKNGETKLINAWKL